MIKEWIKEEYDPQNKAEFKSALRQVMQHIALAGLQRSHFFKHAAFYGGTALRIFYGLPRFSEDLDFSLLTPKPDFNLSPYFKALEQEFESYGIHVSITSKNKSDKSPIESAFLKSESLMQNIVLEWSDSKFGVKEKTYVKIKLEVDTRPPLKFSTEEKLLLKPFSCYIKCFVPRDLYAGKMHALLYRKWKNRVKGRDWFDMEWYIKKGFPLNLSHFKERAVQSGDMPKERPISREKLIKMVHDQIDSTDIEQAKSDVIRFMPEPDSLDIWSQKYFHDIIEHIITTDV